MIDIANHKVMAENSLIHLGQSALVTSFHRYSSKLFEYHLSHTYYRYVFVI